MRRCGKSTLMRQLAAWLLDAGEPADSILFVHFEEPIFLESGRDTRVLELLFELYREELTPGRKPWVFLDEVQNVDGWARWVRATHEKGQANFVVSGSTSRIIEPELGTVLTGRHQTVQLSPFSLRERLRFEGLEDVTWDKPPLSEAVQRALGDMLRFGGLPEAVELQDRRQRDQLLRQLFDDILYRDIVQRHEIRRPQDLQQVAFWYLANTAREAAYNRVKDRYGLSMDQVRAYAGYLEEGYLVRQIERFSFKPHVRSRSPRVVHALDNGVRNAVTFRFSEDRGWLAESLVCQQILRDLRDDTDTELFYFKEKRSCDFVLWRETCAEEVIQVWYGDPDGLVPYRELAGLDDAMQATNARRATLITRDREETAELPSGSEARLVPLARWLLERRTGS